MSTNKENQNAKLVIPPFFDRWSILLRRYPQLFLDVGFLLGVLSGRNPVLWKNVMETEYIRTHAFCDDTAHTEECRQRNSKFRHEFGAWRDDS